MQQSSIVRRSNFFKAASLVGCALIAAELGLAQSSSSPAAFGTPGEGVLDVVVRDRHDKLVRGLTASDFRITDDGKPSRVERLQLIEQEGNQPRFVILLLDGADETIRTAARHAAAEMIKRLENSHVNVSVWAVRDRLELLENFTEDGRTIENAIDGAQRARGLEPQRPKSETSANPVDTGRRCSRTILETSRKMTQERHARPLLAALWSMSREAKAMPGRKTVFLFSNGMQLASSAPELRRAIAGDANRSQLSFYPIDCSGVSAKEADRASHMMMDAMGLATSTAGVSNHANELGMSSSRKGFDAPTGNSQTTALQSLATDTGGAYIDAASDLRKKIRNAAEDVQRYYLVTYSQLIRTSTGEFRPVAVTVDKPGVHVQQRSGYYSLPPLGDREIVPFELPLLQALNSGVKAETIWFDAAVMRVGTGEKPSGILVVQVPLHGLLAREYDTARRFELRLSTLALIRDAAGKVVDVYSQDISLDGANERLSQARKDVYTFQKSFHLPPGSYRADVAISDGNAKKVSVKSTSFVIESVNQTPALSDLIVVRGLRPLDAARVAGDIPLHFKNVEILPDISGRDSLRADPSHPLFFLVSPDRSRSAQPHVEVTVMREGNTVATVPVEVPNPDSDAPIALLPALSEYLNQKGQYEICVRLTQGAHRIERRTAFALQDTTSQTQLASSYLHESADVADTTLSQDLLPAPKLIPNAQKPNDADIETMLQGARERVLDYKRTLPNFVCLMVTRRAVDPTGRGLWKANDSYAKLLGFAGGKEKTVLLEVNGRPVKAEEPLFEGVDVKGEFGELLSMPFLSKSQASVSWQGKAELSGRSVDVFRFDVKRAHSEYLVVANHAGQAMDAAYHALIYVDSSAFCVRRISVEADEIPKNFPVRESVVTVDYDFVSISGQDYLLPLHATLFVRHGAHTLNRNEISFENYRKYGAESTLRLN